MQIVLPMPKELGQNLLVSVSIYLSLKIIKNYIKYCIVIFYS